MPQATVLRAETTQRLGTCYAVVRCQRRAELRAMAVRIARTLTDEARWLPCAPPLPLQAIESAAKGIVYCRSKRLCDELAGALGCPAYYADIEASRVEVLETWRQSGGLIVSTSALGVGVDIPRVLFTLHVERPWTMVDFVQESGRMRSEGKSVIVLVQPPQAQQKQHEQHAQEMNNSEAIEAFVCTAGCQRKVMSQYIDGKQLSCAELQAREVVEGAACDNCEEQQNGGRRAWQDEQAIQAVQDQAVRAKLDELAQSTCPYCWAIVHEVFDGRPSEGGELARQEQEAAMHSLWQCPRVQDIAKAEEVRRRIWYSRDVHTCRKCGIMDYLCT
jgi:superfamily II DNA helicase RecQ